MSPNYSRGLSSLSGPPTAASSPLSPTRTKTLPPRPNSPAVSLNVSGPGPSSHSASSSSSRIRSPPQRRSPPLQNSLPQNQNPNFNGSKVQAPLPSSGATPVSKSAISSVTSGPTSVAESTASSQAPDAHKHLSPTLPSKTSQVLAGGLGSNSTLPPLTSTSLITAPTALSDSKTKDLSITNGAPLPLPMMNVEGKS
ncbi:hypothetical protein GYMLUDRAFT_43638 [Collybiopsis luxurians FD-317 M1]|uniref:Uncharacterized protein n=1 Tax=Collybiopsis luxurians FD-317 M1 TaxID=944289 RepID=A0A0D0B9K1_9AGAR|nr:hypothetical protein GYMLUDRAFT_43638 [Collybiopsis luxurians FD-317 M1]